MSEENDEEEVTDDVKLSATSSAEIRVQKLSSAELKQKEHYTVGQLLRQEQTILFEMIYQSHQVWRKILYCIIYGSLFALLYGTVLGISGGFWNTIGMAVKVPGLLLGTFIICAPLLFSFNMFLGTRLGLLQTVTILLLATYQMSLALLAFAPIVLLFLLYSQSPIFLNIINIFFFIIAISIGLGLVWRAMAYFIARNECPPNTLVMKIWCGVYIFVCVQLAWAIQVFGDLSELPIFKQLQIEGNFYMAIFELIQKWMAGS